MARIIAGYYPDKKTPGMFGRAPGLPIYEEVAQIEESKVKPTQEDTSERIGEVAIEEMGQEPGSRVYSSGDGTSGHY